MSRKKIKKGERTQQYIDPPNYYTFVRLFRSEDVDLSMKDVWGIREGEVGKEGSKILSKLESEYNLWNQIKWTCQAIIEFQDLQDFIIPHYGRVFKRNYLFIEGMFAIRECVLCGINGQFNASLAVLRSALEMTVCHYWYKERYFSKNSYEDFYSWLDGEKGGAPFRNMLKDTFKRIECPDSAVDQTHVENVYSKLCSYSHKPVLRESMVYRGRSNYRKKIIENYQYWMELVNSALWVILHVNIYWKPQCLFPVDITERFGFNPPVGMFFDRSNAVPLKKALGEVVAEKYRRFYQSSQDVADVLDFYNNYETISPKDVLSSWEDEKINDENDPIEARIETRMARTKAVARVLEISMIYGDADEEIADIRPVVNKMMGKLKKESLLEEDD